MKNVSHIVIVETDLYYQNMLERHFQDKNQQVHIFTSGEKLLVSSVKPDLILLNYELSGSLNGLDVLRRIKGEMSRAPVIFLSNYDQIDIAVSSLKQGAFDYIIKDERAFDAIDAAISRYLEFIERQKSRKARSFLYF